MLRRPFHDVIRGRLESGNGTNPLLSRLEVLWQSRGGARRLNGTAFLFSLLLREHPQTAREGARQDFATRHAESCSVALIAQDAAISEKQRYQQITTSDCRHLCISTASAHPQQRGRFRACALLGLHSWGSSITARPFAPTRTDPADRIHGWYCAGNNGPGHGFFFAYRLPKVGRKIPPPPSIPRACILPKGPRELESAGLSRLFY